MGKAIYSIVNENLYKLNQDTKEPTARICKMEPTGAYGIVDSALKTVREKIRINTLESAEIKSNKELVEIMQDKLRDRKVTSVPTVSGDGFQIYLDYTILQGDKELAHNISISPIATKDVAILLGVNVENELVYRRGKVLESETEISFATIGNATDLPIGIMKSCECCSDNEYHFIINELNIYMDMSEIDVDIDDSCQYMCQGCPSSKSRVCGRINVHNSIYNTPYNKCCFGKANVISSSLSDSAIIFSSLDSGIIFQEIIMGFIPRKFIVDLQMVLANLIVVYDETEITNILTDNALNDESEEVENPDVVVVDKEGDDQTTSGDSTENTENP